MSALEKLKSNLSLAEAEHPASRTWHVSLRFNNSQYSSILALAEKVGSKSEAIRFFVELGFEALENDDLFSEVIDSKYQIQQMLDFGEDL